MLFRAVSWFPWLRPCYKHAFQPSSLLAKMQRLCGLTNTAGEATGQNADCLSFTHPLRLLAYPGSRDSLYTFFYRRIVLRQRFPSSPAADVEKHELLYCTAVLRHVQHDTTALLDYRLNGQHFYWPLQLQLIQEM